MLVFPRDGEENAAAFEGTGGTRAVSELRQEADRLAPELVAWRRELHRNPELGFEERRTASFIAEKLLALGIETRTGIAKTGVVGILRAARRAAPGILLRSDMDALPIEERPGREYGSTIPGRMHACGHDGHMAMLLGAATLLVKHGDELRRDVTLCFQPAEEGAGGARAMLDEGVLRLADSREAVALHLWTPCPAGTLHLRSGPMMAAQDEFAARIIGRGGHGALPHAAIDPVVAAAQAIVALQTVVSRSVDPIEPAVVSIGAIHAGSAPNAIPEEARLAGTLRSFREEVRELLRRRLREVLEGTARVAGCRVELDLKPGFPAVVNDPRVVDAIRRIGGVVFGEDNVVEIPPLAASEDFAHFLREVPGAFVFLGAGNPGRGLTAPHHSPDFDFDESVLPRGAELLARIALSPD